MKFSKSRKLRQSVPLFIRTTDDETGTSAGLILLQFPEMKKQVASKVHDVDTDEWLNNFSRFFGVNLKRNIISGGFKMILKELIKC